MSDNVKALTVLATGLYSDGSEIEAQSVEAIALYVESLETSLTALKEENERLKARVAELEGESVKTTDADKQSLIDSMVADMNGEIEG